MADQDPGHHAEFRLVVYTESSVRTVPLEGERWVVGRSDECSIILRDPTVSRKQMVLERVGDEFRFQALSTTNPVLLNGRAARQGSLAVGATLTIGLTRLTLDRRVNLTRVVADPVQTVILTRQVLDEDQPPRPRDLSDVHPDDANCVLESLAWCLTDLGSLADAAEPLLDLALNLTGRRRGMIGIFDVGDSFRALASVDRGDPRRELRVPEHLLREARAARQPYTVTTQAKGSPLERLLAPLGNADGVLLLEEPRRTAATGQELLRLARSLATLIWARLQQTAERVRLRDELLRARFTGTSAQTAVLACVRLQDIRKSLRDSAHLALPIALCGEEGTEKEDLARLVHTASPNASGPFVPLYLAAVAPHRVELELFGSGRGQFAGGALARAHGGTLYLDRPDRLEQHLQERLAAIIAEGRTVAGDQSVPVEVRIVAGLPPIVGAANQDDPSGRLAPALAEVLNSLRFEVPPLRDEPRDVISLAELFLAEMGSDPTGAPRTMTDRAKGLLCTYHWPGNVRELRVTLEGAAAKAGDKPIGPRHLPDEIQNPNPNDLSGLPRLEDLERRHIRTVLARVGGNRARAAQVLGIAVSTLYERIKKYGLN